MNNLTYEDLEDFTCYPSEQEIKTMWKHYDEKNDKIMWDVDSYRRFIFECYIKHQWYILTNESKNYTDSYENPRRNSIKNKKKND